MMTIKEQMNKIIAALGEWCKTNNGSVKIANDVPHLFTILGVNPGSPRTAILFAGEVMRSPDRPETGRVDRKYWIAVSRGRGFLVEQGKSLTEGVGGGAPMFQLVEEAREIVRAIRGATAADEPLPYYISIELMAFEGVTTDTYRLEVVFASDIPEQLDNAA